MKLNKERKIYVALLAVGLSALTVDRVFSSSDAEETPEPPAALIVNKSDAAGTAKASVGATEAAAPDFNPIITRLRTLDEVERLSGTPTEDAFQMPLRWAAAYRTEAPQTRRLSSIEEFQQNHQLNAVMLAGRQSRAIVDGRTISMGQAFDGFKLVEVTERFAVLESSSGQVVLRLNHRPSSTVAGTGQ